MMLKNKTKLRWKRHNNLLSHWNLKYSKLLLIKLILKLRISKKQNKYKYYKLFLVNLIIFHSMITRLSSNQIMQAKTLFNRHKSKNRQIESVFAKTYLKYNTTSMTLIQLKCKIIKSKRIEQTSLGIIKLSRFTSLQHLIYNSGKRSNKKYNQQGQ